MAHAKPSHQDFFNGILKKRVEDLIHTIEASPLTDEQKMLVAFMCTHRLVCATADLTIGGGDPSEKGAPVGKVATQICARISEDVRNTDKVGKQ